MVVPGCSRVKEEEEWMPRRAPSCSEWEEAGLERPSGLADTGSVVIAHDLVKARAQQEVVAKALVSQNETLREQTVGAEALDPLAAVLPKLAAEAAVLAAGHWPVKAGGVMDGDTAVEVVDSTEAGAALSAEDKGRIAEVVVAVAAVAAEDQKAADMVAPT